MSEKEFILNIISRLGLQDRLIKFEDGSIEFYSGWESLVIKFDENGFVKNIN